jgi:sec-independent protein translocase protein TatA
MPIELSAVQILIILAIALVIFGPRRLPELGRSLGQGMREFRDGMRRLSSPLDADVTELSTGKVPAPADETTLQ